MAEHEQIRQVRKQVARGDEQHAEDKRARQVAGGIAQLAGDIVDVVPAAVRKQHRHQRADHRQRIDRRRRRCWRRVVHTQPDRDQRADREQLEYGEDILRKRSGADAEPVDAGEKHDRGDRRRPRISQLHADRFRRVIGEERRHRCNRAGVIHHQQIPAVHERDDQPERLAQIHITAARVRPARAEFGVAQRTDQRDHAADAPSQHLLERGTGFLRDGTGRAEDARTDHAADHDHARVPHAERAHVAHGLLRRRNRRVGRLSDTARSRASGQSMANSQRAVEPQIVMPADDNVLIFGGHDLIRPAAAFQAPP